jgi:predicted phage tail protein
MLETTGNNLDVGSQKEVYRSGQVIEQSQSTRSRTPASVKTSNSEIIRREEEVKVQHRKLSNRAAKNVTRIKIIELIGGLALVGIGVTCVIVAGAIPSMSCNSASTLQTVGSSLAAGGIGLIVGPLQQTAIDKAKKPVEEETSSKQ